MQTAVEWLVETLIRYNLVPKETNSDNVLFNKAKEMEKEQIVEAFDCDGSPQPGEKWISNGEQYYNETYKNK